MKIQKFNPKSPLTGQIGVVQPSTAAVRSAQQQQQTASQLGQMAFKMAVQEQQDVGREYAVNLVTRDEKTGKIEYQEIPDAMSPTARRSAQPLIDTKYQNSLKADLLAKGKLKRVNEDGSSANGKVYTESMESYIAETAKLNPRYAGFINEVGGAVAAQHATDIQIKSYQAAMALDKRNQSSFITEEAIPSLEATSRSDAGFAPSFDSDADGPSEITVRDDLYKNVLTNIKEYVATHNIGDEEQNRLLQSAKTARYGGQVRGVAGRLSALALSQNPNNKFQIEQAYLGAMESALRNPDGLKNQPEYIQAGLAQLGFTEEFVQNTDMTSVRSKLATELSGYAGNRANEEENNKFRKMQDQTVFDVERGAPISTTAADNLFSLNGVTNGYQMATNIGTYLSNQDGVEYKILMGNGPLPTSVIEMMTDTRRRIIYVSRLNTTSYNKHGRVKCL